MITASNLLHHPHPQEAINSLRAAIQDLRTKLAASESNLDNQSSMIYDLRCQGDMVRQHLEEQQTGVDTLRAELGAKDAEIAQMMNRHQMDVS